MSRQTLDVCGTKCPVPIVKAKQAIEGLREGDELEVHATDAGSVLDFRGWARTSKLATLEEQRTIRDESGREVFVHILRRKA